MTIPFPKSTDHLNRLLCHSTLQSIYADSICSHPDKEIWIILWHFEPLTICSFDGRHKVYEATFEQDKEHMYTVLNKLITEQQMINFTEAALIKYFKPFYNDKFKYNFPNQAHKTYAECYDIDLNAVIVELQTDEVFCKLWSEGVESNWLHIAKFLLHSTEERRSMFDFYIDEENITINNNEK